ncbi:hypothetical protein NHX12_011435, partial [Muraenolepis orangiensis]
GSLCVSTLKEMNPDPSLGLAAPQRRSARPGQSASGEKQRRPELPCWRPRPPELSTIKGEESCTMTREVAEDSFPAAHCCTGRQENEDGWEDEEIPVSDDIRPSSLH